MPQQISNPQSTLKQGVEKVQSPQEFPSEFIGSIRSMTVFTGPWGVINILTDGEECKDLPGRGWGDPEYQSKKDQSVVGKWWELHLGWIRKYLFLVSFFPLVICLASIILLFVLFGLTTAKWPPKTKEWVKELRTVLISKQSQSKEYSRMSL